MKIHLVIPVAIFALLTWSAANQRSQAQSTRAQKDSVKTARLAAMIEQKDFVFKADMVYPLGGRSRNLSADNYDLVIAGDTVTAYLPYFGRAYSAPINPSGGGIEFTSTNVDYSSTVRKKGGWEISIKRKDGNDPQQMFLTISTGGYATLQVSSVNRQSISFNGTIVPRKKRK